MDADSRRRSLTPHIQPAAARASTFLFAAPELSPPSSPSPPTPAAPVYTSMAQPGAWDAGLRGVARMFDDGLVGSDALCASVKSLGAEMFSHVPLRPPPPPPPPPHANAPLPAVHGTTGCCARQCYAEMLCDGSLEQARAALQAAKTDGEQARAPGASSRRISPQLGAQVALYTDEHRVAGKCITSLMRVLETFVSRKWMYFRHAEVCEPTVRKDCALSTGLVYVRLPLESTQRIGVHAGLQPRLLDWGRKETVEDLE
jgi:hypothetical protein